MQPCINLKKSLHSALQNAECRLHFAASCRLWQDPGTDTKLVAHLKELQQERRQKSRLESVSQAIKNSKHYETHDTKNSTNYIVDGYPHDNKRSRPLPEIHIGRKSNGGLAVNIIPNKCAGSWGSFSA